MTIRGISFSIPGGSSLVGAIDAQRVLLKNGKTLSIFDVALGAVTASRAIPALTYARTCGAWIEIASGGRTAFVRGDLKGEGVSLPEAGLRVAAVVGVVAVLTNFNEWITFDLERGAVLARKNDDAHWYAASETTGLLFGVRENSRVIVALRVADGSIVWEAKPFAKKVDSIGHPCVRGGEVHVRASGAEDGFAARLDARDGALRSVRPASALLDSWLPDLGQEVDDTLLRYKRRSISRAIGDAFVACQTSQAIIVRANGVARVALPEISGFTAFGNAIAGIVADRAHVSLLVVPLPESGEHDLELVPKGEEAAPVGVDGTGSDAPGKITFAGTSAPIVVVQHPKYGRVNLTRLGSDPPPPLGAEVMFDGVEVKPGGVVRVDRWWLVGARKPREVTRLALDPPELDEPRAVQATHHALSLVGRAKEAGVSIPQDVLRFVELVDRDRAFAKALANLGFHFEEDELGIDVIEDLEIDDFLPVWGNGYGDGYGGLIKDGRLGYVHIKDDRAPRPLPSIVEHVRAEAKDSDQEATVEVVLGVLDRERL